MSKYKSVNYRLQFQYHTVPSDSKNLPRFLLPLFLELFDQSSSHHSLISRTVRPDKTLPYLSQSLSLFARYNSCCATVLITTNYPLEHDSTLGISPTCSQTSATRLSVLSTDSLNTFLFQSKYYDISRTLLLLNRSLHHLSELSCRSFRNGSCL